MERDESVSSLGRLIERLREAPDGGGRVSVRMMIEEVGRKSFGPLILLAGLIAVSPLSGIPGVPTTMATIVLLTSVQVLCGRRHFWLPGWVLNRSVSRGPYEKMLEKFQPVAHAVDRVFRPRLTALTKGAGVHACAAICALVALTMPPLELVPFAATIAGAALLAFGLSIVTHDGVLSIVAILLTTAVVVAVVKNLVMD